MLETKLKELREANKMSQEEFAEKIGTTKNTYMKYERGLQSPKLSTVEQIADYYGISVYELISGNEPTINEKIATKMKLIDELEEKEKESLMIVLEGLLLRHQSKNIGKELRK